MMGMMTVGEFLLARIAEDEEVAAAAKADSADADGHWWWDGVDFEGSWPTSERPKGESYAFQSWEVMAERFDPARVLAECEAKRRIVERATATMGARTPDDVDFYHAAYDLMDLALPYADHPDYDEAWRR